METEAEPAPLPPALPPRPARSVGPFGIVCAYAATVTLAFVSGAFVLVAMLAWLPVVPLASGLASAAAGRLDGRRVSRVEVFAGRRVRRVTARGAEVAIGWRVLRGVTVVPEPDDGSSRPGWRAAIADHAGPATVLLLFVLGAVGTVTAGRAASVAGLGLAWVCLLVALGVVRTVDREVLPLLGGGPVTTWLAGEASDGTEAATLHGAAWAAYDAGHMDLAWALSRQALVSSGPGESRVHEWVHNQLASIGLVDGRDEWFDEAAVHAAAAVQLDPCAATYDTWAWVLLRRGRAVEAHAWFAAAFRAARMDRFDAGTAVTAKGLAGAAVALGDVELARAWRRIARRLDPAARLAVPAWHRHPPAPDPGWQRTPLDRWALRAPRRRVERWLATLTVGSLPVLALFAVALVRPPLAVLSLVSGWSIVLGFLVWAAYGRVRRL